MTDGKVYRADLTERLRHFTTANYLATSDLLSSGVVAVAAGVGLEIVVAQDPVRLLFWITSLTLFVSMHALWRLGALFAGWSSGLADPIVPLLLGLFEFAQFIVLSSQVDVPQWQVIWLATAAGQFAMAAWFVHNRLRQLDVPGQYGDDAAPLVARYRSFMDQGRRRSAAGAGVLAGIALAAAVLGHHLPHALELAGVAFALWAGLVALIGGVTAQRSFQQTLFSGQGPPNP